MDHDDSSAVTWAEPFELAYTYRDDDDQDDDPDCAAFWAAYRRADSQRRQCVLLEFAEPYKSWLCWTRVELITTAEQCRPRPYVTSGTGGPRG
jgi:hypothetical protein